MAVIAVTERQALTSHTINVVLLVLRLMGFRVAGGRFSVGMLLLAFIVSTVWSIVLMIGIIGRRNTEGVGHRIIFISPSVPSLVSPTILCFSVPSLIIGIVLLCSFPLPIITTGSNPSAIISSRG